MRGWFDGAGLGCTALAGFTAMIAVVVGLGNAGWPVWLTVPLGLLAVLVVGLVGSILTGWLEWGSSGSPGDTRERLEARGLLVSTAYRAKRAVEVMEWEDEGSHYLLELEDGTVLYLSGQFLYDYEPIDDDPELAQPRSFPCTELVVHVHRTKGYVVALDCGGEVIEPEATLPPDRLHGVIERLEGMGASVEYWTEVVHAEGRPFDEVVGQGASQGGS